MDEQTRIKRLRLGRKPDASPGTRSRWRELDGIHAKRATEPENWPYQCYCSYRYESRMVLRRHITHANKFSQVEGLHRPFVSRNAF